MNPLIAFLKTHLYLLSGRIHFPQTRVGQTLKLEEDQTWIIFREVRLDIGSDRSKQAGAVFRPRFHVAGMSVRTNIWFSLLPIPFFISLPGFRSKLWLYQPESGDFQGIYEWDTLEDAQNYAESFAMRFMESRSVPGSVSYQVIPL